LSPPPFLAAPPAARVPAAPPPGAGGAATFAPAAPPVAAPRAAPTGGAPPDRAAGPANAAAAIPLGRRSAPGGNGDPVALAASLLPRHTVVLAGSGSGKTVLLRRIVEEAALAGIPSLVLDANNDLARLGAAWPAAPEGWSEEDRAKATAYHARADVVVWTPGVNGGNPLSLQLLPDFAAIGLDEAAADERSQAVEMARATLSPYLAGSGQKAQLRQGVLADALRALASRGGRSLDDLVRLLAEPPDGFSQIGGAEGLAAEMANQLLAVIAANPLLQADGAGLDPRRLFQGASGRTRVSVINLAGLGSDEARQAFVNQLNMTLFSWIKRHPSAAGRLYVVDEAQGFAPSQAATACKASTLSLAAQARKYGLGMVFATQHPRGIDNGIVSNCTTQVYGRMSSPAALQAIRELMAAKGGAADDIGRLSRGEFYVSSEGFNRPIRIRAPLCLSWHPPNPPTAEEVAAIAAAARG
jgi:hypothetical protein